jgi:hypothetical protein
MGWIQGHKYVVIESKYFPRTWALLLKERDQIPHSVQMGRQRKHRNNQMLMLKNMTVHIQYLQQVILSVCL